MSKITTMKKVFFAVITLFFLNSCTSDTTTNDILPFVPVDETIDLSLPEYIDLQVPGGWAYAPGGIKGIIIYNLNGTQFKSFERAAPHIQPSACSQMIVENALRMRCQCDDSEFNILNGAPLTDGITYTAREYLVTNLNGAILRITNF
jgi:nitrite reductase/ring-hydroxylating ferredoxin subunit